MSNFHIGLTEDKSLRLRGKPLQEVVRQYAEEHNLKVVMHFPHSSLAVPASFWEDVGIDKGYFDFINLQMSDLCLLDLFSSWDFEKVIAPYSRLYVDVEKYWDEAKEPMAKFGMGAVYSKDIFGNDLHKRTPLFMAEAKEYYDHHHELLSKACDCDKDVLILDIHSFGYRMSRLVTGRHAVPDLCFGQNKDDSDCPDLVELIKLWLKANCKCRYQTNYPYIGSILPNRRRAGQRIYSLMLEFNKRFYL